MRLIALAALLVTHAIFWIVSQPVDKFWLKNQQLEGIGMRFFYPTGPMTQPGEQADTDKDWKRMPDRWEYSHLVRAVLSVIALVTLAVALSMSR